MTRVFRISFSALLCVFLCVSAVFAQSENGGKNGDDDKNDRKKIVIISASIDSTMTRITIGGMNFLGPNGFDGIPLSRRLEAYRGNE